MRDYVDDTSEVQEKVQRSPLLGDWGSKLADVRISYHGEIVEKSQHLTLDQIRPGLPLLAMELACPWQNSAMENSRKS